MDSTTINDSETVRKRRKIVADEDVETGDPIYTTRKELRAHKINRAIFLFVLIVLGVHILCALNTTYDGYSLAQIGGKRYIQRDTSIQYFGVIPIWVSNIFYALYVIYGILLLYGITGIIGRAKKVK